MTTTTSYKERPLPAQVPRVNIDGSFTILRPVWIPNFEEAQRMSEFHIVEIRLIDGRCNPAIETFGQLDEAIADLKKDLIAVCNENGFFPKDTRVIAVSFIDGKEESE